MLVGTEYRKTRHRDLFECAGQETETVNGVVIEKNTLDKMINVFGHIISPLLGRHFHTTSYYSKQTGGDVATVGRPEEFAKAINSLIGNFAARYNIGFTIGENERDDGRMHRLEVKVKARDARGKERSLKVNARRGYWRGGAPGAWCKP